MVDGVDHGAHLGPAATDSSAAADALPDFEQRTQALVDGAAPRVFALVHEYDHVPGAHLRAWGMAFPDHVEIVSAGGGVRMSMGSLDRALVGFRREGAITHVFWAGDAVPLGS
ncbi:hypothetical protein [Actinoalloteichus hymeniacidonis]|uniref:Uncharacterized protein n=1 Tax=Actinoalloteichus hymeniacidonis TaxID=340345 RepID=A0AAC9HPP8_9PSEU|nr:hypothetical protein [Actinoalloteichus hymeniacidonis]AOS63312.1 hypothetical protein TL08_12490 [Actinoalloteichus hymeniacidonis]MBB5908649.1 hypothetical protein [Actinoalloteichus hymeniacidonis]